MQHPRILGPLTELFARAGAALVEGGGGGGGGLWAHLVAGGGFNAGTREAGLDFENGIPAGSLLREARAEGGEGGGDRFLVGPGVSVKRCSSVGAFELLQMDTQKRGEGGGGFLIHERNAALLAEGRVVSDHYPLLLEVELEQVAEKGHLAKVAAPTGMV